MEIYKNEIKIEKDLNKYFDSENICFIDIETLGFSRKYHRIYLVGLVYFSKEKNSWIIEQIFANSPDKEKILLKTLNDRLKSFDLLVTYNGDSFDLPFIRDRYSKYRIENNIMDMNSFDIYREIRKYGKYLNLKNMKLKTVEEYLGIFREDEFTGGDCIQLYLEYVDTGDEKLKDFVLMHNYEDLYYLTDILDILDHINNKISFEINNILFKIEDIKINSTSMNIVVKSSKKLNLIYYKDSYSIKSLDDSHIKIELKLEKACIEPDKLCQYFDTRILEENILDTTRYKLPNNILIMEIEGKEIIENLRILLKRLFIENRII